MIEYDFTRKYAGRADVEKFILSTDEFKDVSTRILTLGISDPIEFFIERDNYTFDIYVKSFDDVLVSHYNEKFDFRIKLLIDIKLFDTINKIYIPSPIDEVEIIGDSITTEFTNRCIGGIHFNESQKVVVSPNIFSNLIIKEYPLYGEFISNDGEDLNFLVFRNCNILKLRHIYDKEHYEKLIKNGNKINSISHFHINFKLRDLLNDYSLLSFLEVTDCVVNWNISVMFTNSNLHNFTYKSYMEDVLFIVAKFKELNLKSTLMVEFIPAIIINMYKKMDIEYKQLLMNSLLEYSDRKMNFGVYMS